VFRLSLEVVARPQTRVDMVVDISRRAANVKLGNQRRLQMSRVNTTGSCYCAMLDSSHLVIRRCESCCMTD
jgi:hypothetical protein